MEDYLTVSQAAEKIGVSLLTVYKYLNQGKLKGFKIGGNSPKRHWRIRPADLESFITANSK